MEHDRNRRRFLRATGAGAALSLAGCLDSFGGDGGDDDDGAPDLGNGVDAGSQDDGNESTTDGNESDSQGDGETDASDLDGILTAVVEPDQEQMAAVEQELNQQIQNETISQQEASQQYQQEQMALTEEAAESFESSAGEIDDVTIEDSVAQLGAFLLDGDPAAMVEILNDEDEAVSALLPVETFQQAAGQGPGMQP